VYELIEKSPLLVSASNKLAASIGARSLKAVSYDISAGSELDTGGVSDEVVTEVESSDKATTETVVATEVSDKDLSSSVDKEDASSLPVDIGSLSLLIPADGLPSSVTESAPKIPAEHVSYPLAFLPLSLSHLPFLSPHLPSLLFTHPLLSYLSSYISSHLTSPHHSSLLLPSVSPRIASDPR
jgi:hypothetical protein